MKILKLKILNTSSAHKAGAGLRGKVILHGLKESTVRHIKDIFTNHSDNKLKEFINGLTGI